MDMPGSYRGTLEGERGSAAACGHCEEVKLFGNSKKPAGGHGASCWRLRIFLLCPTEDLQLQNATVSGKT
jgi:hypothetical protein